jgi:hypothetical protein
MTSTVSGRAGRSGVDRDAGAAFQDAVDILVQDARGQAEAGDAPLHHAAGPVELFVDIHVIAGQRQILRGGQPGRAAAHDADALVLARLDRVEMGIGAQFVHHVALQIADRQRAVAVGAAAGRLAGRIADPSADRTERVGRGDRLEGLQLLAFPDQADIGGRVGADRTGDLARCRREMQIVGIVAQIKRAPARPHQGSGKFIVSHLSSP